MPLHDKTEIPSDIPSAAFVLPAAETTADADLDSYSYRSLPFSYHTTFLIKKQQKIYTLLQNADIIKPS